MPQPKKPKEKKGDGVGTIAKGKPANSFDFFSFLSVIPARELAIHERVISILLWRPHG